MRPLMFHIRRASCLLFTSCGWELYYRWTYQASIETDLQRPWIQILLAKGQVSLRNNLPRDIRQCTNVPTLLLYNMKDLTTRLIATLAVVRAVQYPIFVVTVGLSICSTAKLGTYDGLNHEGGTTSAELNTSISSNNLHKAAIIDLTAALTSLLAATCIGCLHLNLR